MSTNPIVSRAEWLEARRDLLTLEKQETHLRDRVRAARQALPWVAVDKDYRFTATDGERTLADLFDGRSQLVVYHFMLAPGWEAGCVGCSFLADHFDGMIRHISHHDVTLTAVSRAPISEIEAYRHRMGWTFPWVSSHGSDFNYDYHVSFTPEELVSGSVLYNFEPLPSDQALEELHGLSAFYKDGDGRVFHTYSSYARGAEDLIGTLLLLDRAPKGRNEQGTMNWVRRHDDYADDTPAAGCCSA